MAKLEDKFKKQEKKNDSLFGKFQAAPTQEAPAVEPIAETPVTPLASALDRGLPTLPPESEVRSIKDLDKFSSATRTGLDKENQEWLKMQTDKLKELNMEAKSVYDKNRSKIDMARLGAALAQGLTQIAYGLRGLKSGTSGGPLQFNKTDWENNYNNVLQEYKAAISSNSAEAESEGAQYKSRSGERARLGEERINRTEQMLRERNARNKEARKEEDRQTSRKPDNSMEKTLADFRKIEKLQAQIEEASSDKEKAKLLGDIFILLKQPEEGAKSVKELDELSEKDSRPWYDFISEKKDLLGDYIQQVKSDRIAAIRGNEPVPPAEASLPTSSSSEPGMTEVRVPDGRVLMIPNENLDKALKAGAKLTR